MKRYQTQPSTPVVHSAHTVHFHPKGLSRVRMSDTVQISLQCSSGLLNLLNERCTKKSVVGLLLRRLLAKADMRPWLTRMTAVWTGAHWGSL